MPFSFSNIGTTALLLMIGFLTIAELVKYFKRHSHHLEK